MTDLMSATPRVAGRSNIKPKMITCQVYNHVAVDEYHGVHAPDGALVVILPTEQTTSRLKAEADRRLGFLSGLCANDMAKHPKWEQPLRDHCTDLVTFGYERPQAQNNFSKFAFDLVENGQTVRKEAPGTWVYQILGTTLEKALDLLHTTFQLTLFLDGWEADKTSGIFYRVVRA